MGEPRGSAERTQARILAVARELFAAQGVDTVTVRDIAASTGVTHALVHRYFGTKEQIVAEIVRREVQAAAALPAALEQEALAPLEVIRRMLQYGLTDARPTVLLITRAELAGLEPEKMLGDKEFRPIGMMADWLEQRHAEAGRPDGASDPALLSAVVGGAVFALQVLGPWLSAAVGLQPEDLAARGEKILDILVDLVARTAGLPTQEPGSPS